MGREQILEEEFEKNICEYLGTDAGWIYSVGQSAAEARRESARLFDTELALIPSDVLWWLKSEYPQEYEKAIDPELDDADRHAKEQALLKHVVRELKKNSEVDPRTGRVCGGLIGVLRNGFHYAQVGRPAAHFEKMMEFTPANPNLVDVAEAAGRVRLRVLRQVRFDTCSNETIDVVLFANGIPVVTMELKTDNTQSCTAAERQYRNDRKPDEKCRPLLAPGRCLVHFAVSNTRVSMTTVLQGKTTRFLPFNRGNNGHAGNPVSTTGSDTDYLWREVLERESFMRIIRDFVMWEKSKEGKGGRLVFPRFHQRRAVERIVTDIETHGLGRKYLVWHSAGSGKTKTIAWLAHRLIRHMDSAGQSSFDSVIVITDRTVLDENVRGDMLTMEASAGLVIAVGQKGVAGGGQKHYLSKSEQLKEALLEGNHIITCTLQTFPQVVKLIEEDERLSDRSWAIIADEAHSSQTGSAASQMRGLLAQMDLDPDKAQDLTPEDLMAAKDTAIATAKNLTFIAFTATPKAKTLALFGSQMQGRYMAFDTYTMAQAIEEGFILDVLRNYSTYEMWLEVKNQIAANNNLDVDTGQAVQRIMRFVRLSEIVIGQKVQIAVEHFRRNVMRKLGGQAKAMVVTNSRKEAVRWALEIKKYLDEQGYTDMDSLVAFSDTVKLDGVEYTEAGMNALSDTAKAFKEDDLNKVLIVARKFQTGFDEPRLLAMYVDKPLDGIEAVQTLSRLNRIYPNKQDPMIVDFCNEPENIQEAFKVYYEDASITTDINANALYTIADRIDTAGFYTDEQMSNISQAYIENKSGEEISKLLSPIRQTWNDQMARARRIGDKTLKDHALSFRSDLIKYHNAWQFLSQIVDYQDPKLHRRAILANLLFRNLHVNDYNLPEDDSYMAGVELNGLEISDTRIGVDVGLRVGEGELTMPTFDGEPFVSGIPQRGKFYTVIEKVNELFKKHGINVSTSSVEAVFKPVFDYLLENKEIREIARFSTAQQLAQSSQFHDAVQIGLYKFRKEAEEIQAALNDPTLRAGVIAMLAPAIQESCHDRQGEN